MKSKYKKILALVLACVMVFALPCVASASYLTKPSEDYKYEDLPSFSAYNVVYFPQLSGFIKAHNFIITYAPNGLYYLFVVYGADAYISEDAGVIRLNCDVPTVYTDTQFDTVKGQGSNPYVRVYTCSSGDDTWSYNQQMTSFGLNSYGELLYNSGVIYDSPECDNSYMDINVPQDSVSGVTSGDMFETLASEIVGILPVVLGFSVGVLAFWKGYYYLRSALKKA